MASFAIGPSIMAVSCSTSQENNIIMLFWVDLLVTWVFSFTHVMSIGIIGKCSELTRIYWHTLIVHEHQNVPWKTSFHWSYTSSIHHLYILFNVYSDMPDTSTCPSCHRAGFFFSTWNQHEDWIHMSVLNSSNQRNQLKEQLQQNNSSTQSEFVTQEINHIYI